MLHEDPGAKVAKAESATGVGGGELEGVWSRKRKRRLQMTESRCCVGNAII